MLISWAWQPQDCQPRLDVPGAAPARRQLRVRARRVGLQQRDPRTAVPAVTGVLMSVSLVGVCSSYGSLVALCSLSLGSLRWNRHQIGLDFTLRFARGENSRTVRHCSAPGWVAPRAAQFFRLSRVSESARVRCPRARHGLPGVVRGAPSPCLPSSTIHSREYAGAWDLGRALLNTALVTGPCHWRPGAARRLASPRRQRSWWRMRR